MVWVTYEAGCRASKHVGRMVCIYKFQFLTNISFPLPKLPVLR